MKKKRNPQDATLRNIRALKKRVGKLERNFDRFMASYCLLLKKLDLYYERKSLLPGGKKK